MNSRSASRMPGHRATAGSPTIDHRLASTLDRTIYHRASVPDLTPLASSLAIALLLLVMLWFALGTQRNIARGNALLRWMQTGLPLVGKRTNLRWLGSSAVILGINDPEPPFREAEVLLVLEPRDLPWLWLFSRGRGRRDFIIVRGSLRRAPRFEVEAGDRRGWTGQDHLGRLSDGEWQELRWGGPELRAAHSGGDPAEIEALKPLWDRIGSASGGVWRLSVQRVVPHVEIHVLPPDTARVSADRMFRPIVELARSLAKER
jgi:hypothetical protein